MEEQNPTSTALWIDFIQLNATELIQNFVYDRTMRISRSRLKSSILDGNSTVHRRKRWRPYTDLHDAGCVYHTGLILQCCVYHTGFPVSSFPCYHDTSRSFNRIAQVLNL